MKRKATSSPDRATDPAQPRGDQGTPTEPALHREPRPATNDDEAARTPAPRRKRREPFVL
jgi:hypothetical protein